MVIQLWQIGRDGQRWPESRVNLNVWRHREGDIDYVNEPEQSADLVAAEIVALCKHLDVQMELSITVEEGSSTSLTFTNGRRGWEFETTLLMWLTASIAMVENSDTDSGPATGIRRRPRLVD